MAATREATPTGELARTALLELLLQGSPFREAVATTRTRLERSALAAKLAARGHPAGVAAAAPVPALDAWLLARLQALGVEHADDLALLSASDFVTAAMLGFVTEPVVAS